jgi:hypothetical protein
MTTLINDIWDEPPLSEDDAWAIAWLSKTYGGAPDECSYCYREGQLVKIHDCKNAAHH